MIRINGLHVFNLARTYVLIPFSSPYPLVFADAAEGKKRLSEALKTAKTFVDYTDSQ